MIANPEHNIRVAKAADETVNNSTVMQDDDELKFPIGANETWLVELFLLTQAASGTPDFKTGFSYPAGCAIFWGIGSSEGNYPWNSRAPGNAAVVPQTEASTPGWATRNGYILTLIRAIVINGATAGTLAFQWAQNTADVSDLTVKANSLLRATPMF